MQDLMQYLMQERKQEWKQEHQQCIDRIEALTQKISYKNTLLIVLPMFPEDIILYIDEFIGRTKIGDLVADLYLSNGAIDPLSRNHLFHKSWYKERAKQFRKKQLLDLNSHIRGWCWDHVRKYWTKEQILWSLHDGIDVIKEFYNRTAP
jgi:hypothetical protein